MQYSNTHRHFASLCTYRHLEIPINCFIFLLGYTQKKKKSKGIHLLKETAFKIPTISENSLVVADINFK